jgi:uncharacterized coiled-coil protein SlyX
MVNNILKLVLCLILLISTISAASISIDSINSVPAGTLWTTTIEYKLDSGQEAKVFLDDESLLTFFEYNQSVFVDTSKNSSKVLNYNVSNNELTLSIAGMQEGKYSLDAKLYFGDELIESDSIEIEFYDWQDKINSLENTINSQNKLIQTLGNDLNAKALEIEKLKINNQLTIESLRQITSNVSSLQQSDLDKNSSLEKINLDLNQLLKDKELETGLTGLFSFTSNPLSWVALIGIIALIGVGVVLYNNKKKKDSLY